MGSLVFKKRHWRLQERWQAAAAAALVDSRSNLELPLSPLQVPGAATSHLQSHHGLWRHVRAATATKNPRKGHTNVHMMYMIRTTHTHDVHGALHVHIACQGDNSQHTLRLEAADACTKTALEPNVLLTPLKQHKNVSTYKKPSKVRENCFS